MKKTMPALKSAHLLKSAASALVLALLPLGANAAECFDNETDDPKAGNATAVVGPEVDVDRMSQSAIFRPESGDDMFTGDTVRTGDESHLQLKLCDWSTYTFSPNSESSISEFYDPSGAGRRRIVNYARGGLRMSSGRDTEPGATDVEIQESGVTMGVRGT
ncbi:MAG: FecR domain-containing protein, partial [Oricola sp.]|nr:FecR domain-containing protein [Oricola sp.]